jgi:hypothetical protein
MKPSEIIAVDADQNGYGVSPEELTAMVIERRNEGWQLTQDGDTLFCYITTDNRGTIEFDIMMGNPQTAPQSCEKFFNMLKKAGAKSAFSTYMNPQLQGIFKSVKGYKPSFSRGDEYVIKVRL